MVFGISTAGFSKKTTEQLNTDLKDNLKAVEPLAIVTNTNVFGNIRTVCVLLLDEMWNLAEGVFNNRSVNSAEGAALDDLTALNNLTRLGASKSVIPNYELTVPAGTVLNNTLNFISSADPNIIFNYTGPEITVVDDGGGVGTNTITLTAVAWGDIHVDQNEVYTISPYQGAVEVSHPASVDGRNIETDEEYKARRELMLNLTVGGTLNGIKRALLMLNEDTTKPVLTYVDCVQNDGNATDAYGRPAGSIECVVLHTFSGINGDIRTARNLEIAQTIFEAKGGGINAFGALTPIVVTDPDGRLFTCTFTEPIAVSICVTLHLKLVPGITSEQRESAFTLLRNNIVEWGNALGIGTDVIVMGPDSLSSILVHPYIQRVVTAFVGKSWPNPATESYIEIQDGYGATTPEYAVFTTGYISITSE